MDRPEPLILAELEDRAEQIFASLANLRDALDDGKAKREILEAIFRDVHSLKAAAMSNGLPTVSRVAHEFENQLHSLRVGRSQLNENLLETFDEIAESLFDNLTDEPGAVERARDLVDRLQVLSDPPGFRPREEVDIVLSALPPEVWQSLSEGERHRLQESVSEGANLFLVSTNFELGEFDSLFQKLKEHLASRGEIVSTAPRVNEVDGKTIDFRILYTRDVDLEKVREDLREFNDVSITEVVDEAHRSQTAPPDNPSTQTVSIFDRKTRSLASASIRINLEDLDRLISSAHTLFRQTTNCLDTAIDSLQEQKVSSLVKTEAASLNDSFLALASELVNLRMVTIERVLQRALRAGRAVARAVGKEVDFEVRGADLLIDKSLSEAIADPLIHLVRNAVDHGIETPAERLAAGKSARARISITAANVQGQTRITVVDDGRGIDLNSISETAAELGVVPHGYQVGMEQGLRLIFRPGLSTASRVSGTSGRGVGLDAVENAVEDVGGGIQVSSMPGKGSSFEVRLPVTFGLIDVIAAKIAGRRYLIDQAQVVACYPAPAQVDDVKAFKVGDETIPLLPLQDKLNAGELPLDQWTTKTVVVCELGRKDPLDLHRVALLVDEVGDPEKVLVRNLGSRGSRWFGIAGASELRDGTVALLLDLPRLIGD